MEFQCISLEVVLGVEKILFDGLSSCLKLVEIRNFDVKPTGRVLDMLYTGEKYLCICGSSYILALQVGVPRSDSLRVTSLFIPFLSLSPPSGVNDIDVCPKSRPLSCRYGGILSYLSFTARFVICLEDTRPCFVSHRYSVAQTFVAARALSR